MFPAKALREPKDFGDLVPEPLKKAYVSTVEALAAHNYVATAVGSRRTLEGIFKYRLSGAERNKPLARMIELVMQSVDLSEPLKTLSHAIRQGGNLGAHFDEDREPTADLAEQMVDLLEYLIEYLYTLPKEIAKLEATMNATPPQTEPSGP